MSASSDTELKIAITKIQVLVWEAKRQIKGIDVEIHDKYHQMMCLKSVYTEYEKLPKGSKVFVPKGRMFCSADLDNMMTLTRRRIEDLTTDIEAKEKEQMMLEKQIKEYEERIEALQVIQSEG